MKHYFKFNKESTQEIDIKINDDFIINILNKGDKLFTGIDNILKYGIYKLGGWQYDFKDILKLYVIKTSIGINEYYCNNKTNLRKLIFGNIAYIIEVK